MKQKGFLARLREDWSKGISVKKQLTNAWKLLVLVTNDQRKNIIFFLFLGAVLTLGIVLFPTALSEGLLAIYNEHLAFKTIGLLFAVCVIILAVLYPFQRKKTYAEGEEWLAFKVVNVPAKFGEDLCAVAFGMLLIPNVAMATQVGGLEALTILGLQCLLLICATLFRKMPYIIYSQEWKTDHARVDVIFYLALMVAGLFTAYKVIIMK